MRTAMVQKMVWQDVQETIYEFDELSADAKEKAINDYRESHYDEDYPWWEEVRDTINEIGKHLGMNPDWEISLCSYSHIEFDGNTEDLSGVRAYKWIFNNWIEPLYTARSFYHGMTCKRKSKVFFRMDCPFTGYYLDENFVDAWNEFAAEIKAGKDLSIDDFVQMVGEKLCEAIVDDWEYTTSDEYIQDELRQEEFFGDGTMVS